MSDNKQRSTHNIVRIENKSGNTFIHFSDGLLECVEPGIDELEQDLSDLEFWRVHPNHLINPAYFNRVTSITNKCIVMQDGTELPVMENLLSHKLEANRIGSSIWQRLKRCVTLNFKGKP